MLQGIMAADFEFQHSSSVATMDGMDANRISGVRPHYWRIGITDRLTANAGRRTEHTG